MNKLMQQFQRYALLRAVIYILAGILIILYPQQFTQMIIHLVAAYVGFLGLMNVWTAFREKKQIGYYGFDMLVGVLLLVAAAAILVLVKPIFTIITVFLGILIVLNGCTRIVQGFNLKNLQQHYLSWLLYGGLLIIGGFILMFHAVASIMTLFGSILIFMGISELVGYFQIRRTFS